ncbi:MAG: tyrosine-type recombinase/integrase [Prevotellaceae bacterium]|nr:tyrosine-type recombinase/integrase [Prevotellaceae bacterium]
MLQRFLRYLQSEKRYSFHTLRAYESDLMQLAEFTQVDADVLQSLTHRQLRNWYSNLLAEGISTRSVNRKISSVSAFFKFLAREGVISQNPIEKVVNPKNSKRLPFFYKEEQLNSILDKDFSQDDYVAERDHLIIELLYGTGIRLSELVGLKVGDISISNQSMKVMGKGGKERIIPLNPHLIRQLKDYLHQQKLKFAVAVNTSLFLTEKGNPIYQGLVYRVVRKELTKEGVAGKKSPHILRHSFATHMLNNGADLNSIKDLLGHSSLSATQVYTHNNIEKLMKSYHQAHPHA